MLALDRVGKRLPNGEPLFRDLNFSAEAGEAVALIGRSGSGKSTLLAGLGLMHQFDEGSYQLAGVDTAALSTTARDRMRAENVGFVFQRFALIPHLSVLENVMTPLRHRSSSGRSNMQARALDVLESVDMAAHARKKPSQLSGGEQQRVSIARALVTNPRLVLADEPTGSLDQSTGSTVMAILRRAADERGAVLVVVTHDVEIAGRLDSAYALDQGNLTRVERSGRAPAHARS